MSEVMTPNHANFLGKVFGGSILSLLDLCAYTTATRFAGNICVTASFDRVDFHDPIEVGEFVTFIGKVYFAGKTSVEVTIEVFAEDVIRAKRRHTNTARVTMVAVKDGKPTPVPQLMCNSREEKLRFLEGRLRRELARSRKAGLESLFSTLEGLSDVQLEKLLHHEDSVYNELVSASGLQ